MTFWEWAFLAGMITALNTFFVLMETVGKRRFMRRMWDHDRAEWSGIFGMSDVDFLRRRGPRP